MENEELVGHVVSRCNKLIDADRKCSERLIENHKQKITQLDIQQQRVQDVSNDLDMYKEVISKAKNLTTVLYLAFNDMNKSEFRFYSEPNYDKNLMLFSDPNTTDNLERIYARYTSEKEIIYRTVIDNFLTDSDKYDEFKRCIGEARYWTSHNQVNRWSLFDSACWVEDFYDNFYEQKLRPDIEYLQNYFGIIFEHSSSYNYYSYTTRLVSLDCSSIISLLYFYVFAYNDEERLKEITRVVKRVLVERDLL